MLRWLDMVANRQLMRRVAVDAGIHVLATVVDLLPSMRRRQATFRLIEDIQYAHHAGETLYLDVLQPKGPGPHPVLIYFHGGGFAIGSKRTHRALAAAYAVQGYLVCNVGYRLAPKHPFPAALEDACAAWLWAADHVAEYGGDPQCVTLVGESAGANLALSVTLACCTARPEAYAKPLFIRGLRPVAALLYCGFLQTSHPERYRRAGVSALAARIATDAARSYLGSAASQPCPQHALADPLCVLEVMATAPDLLPIFIAAGLADPVAADSQRLEQVLQRLQLPHTARYYPGETHAFHAMFWREQALVCWRDSFEFLRRQAHPHLVDHPTHRESEPHAPG